MWSRKILVGYVEHGEIAHDLADGEPEPNLQDPAFRPKYQLVF